MEIKEITKNDDIESIIEGILFVAGEPVETSKIAQQLNIPEKDIEQAAKKLSDYYDINRRGIKLLRLDGKLQLCSRSDYAEYIRAVLQKKKKPVLSKAALEVLAIIAYRQPATRAYIEHVRGVDSSGTVAALEDKGLIEECGRLEVPGRPLLYKTTDNFLRSFGLSELSELPKLGDDDVNIPD